MRGLLRNEILGRLFEPGIVVVFFSIGFYYVSVVDGANNSSDSSLIQVQSEIQEFRSSLSNIVNQSQILTKLYQDEIGKWNSKQYDNSTMISITDSYIPKFEKITSSARNLTYPKDYKYVYDALVNSLKSETESYKHFKNYLLSGNKTEDEISTDLLTKSFEDEMIYSKFLSMSLQQPAQTVTTRLYTADSLFFNF